VTKNGFGQRSPVISNTYYKVHAVHENSEPNPCLIASPDNEQLEIDVFYVRDFSFCSNIEARDAKGCTPLHLCVVFDQISTACLLLGRGANVDAKDNEGSTPLHLASAFSDADTVHLLITYGGNVKAKDSEGSIALHIAAALGKTNTVHVLIDAGSDVNAPDVNEDTPLQVSAGSGHLEVVCLLLDNGADLSAVDKEGRKLAVCAKLYGHNKVEQCL